VKQYRLTVKKVSTIGNDKYKYFDKETRVRDCYVIILA